MLKFSSALSHFCWLIQSMQSFDPSGCNRINECGWIQNPLDIILIQSRHSFIVLEAATVSLNMISITSFLETNGPIQNWDDLRSKYFNFNLKWSNNQSMVTDWWLHVFFSFWYFLSFLLYILETLRSIGKVCVWCVMCFPNIVFNL